jgi:hypothetical protein
MTECTFMMEGADFEGCAKLLFLERAKEQLF